jgi:hypothetical protein
MKKVWKWIIGIVLVIVVLAVLVGVSFIVRSDFHAGRVDVEAGPGYYQRGPEMMPYGGFSHMRRPGMMSYGRMPMGGFFSGLFSLGFLVLLVLGIIWFVQRLNKPSPAVVAPFTTMQGSVPVNTPAPVQAEVVNPCKKCGKPIQDEWKVCPYCGKKV